MAEPRREKTETQKNYTNYAGLKNWGWGGRHLIQASRRLGPLP